MTSAKGLLLDIGGVVLRNAQELLPRRAERDDALAAYLHETDLGGPADELWQEMLAHRVTERAYWLQRSGEVGRVLGHEGWETFDMITWLYHSADRDWLDDDVVQLMHDVRDAGLALAALTNDLVDFHGQAWADEQGWLRVFDQIIDGSITGVLKPDPRAYAAAVAAMALEPDEVVYLDDMPWNIAGGVAAGLQSIQVVYADRHLAVADARRRLGLTLATTPA